MNRKQLGILFVLVVVIGGAGLVVYKNQKQDRAAGNAGLGQKLLGDLPVNDITHLRISQGTNQVNVIRKDNLWRVAERNEYPANFTQLSEFIVKVRDLKVVQAEEIGPSQLGRLQLAGDGTNGPTVVQFMAAGGKGVGSLLLGKMHMSTRRNPSPYGDMDGGAGWPDGRYVQAGGSSGTVAVVSETFDNIEPKPEQWLNKDFVKIERPKSIGVSFNEATNSWKLVRETETGEWTLAEAKTEEKLDSTKTSGVTSPFSSVSFTDVLPGDRVAAGGANQPTTVKVETFDGFAYTIKVGEPQNDAYPVVLSVAANFERERKAPADEKSEDKDKLDKEFKERLQKQEEKLKQEQAYQAWTYLVSTWTVEPLLKKRSELLEEKKEEAPANDGAASTNAEPKLEDPALPAVHPNH